VNREQGNLRQAEQSLRSIVDQRTAEMVQRGFDFSLDYHVLNLLGQTLFDLANQEIGSARDAARDALLHQAIEQFERTLAIDSENVTAHYNLQLLYARLGDDEQSEFHRQQHARYKPDDNARDHAVSVARQKYPAANHAAEAFVIYPLQRTGAPGLGLARALPLESETQNGGTE